MASVRARKTAGQKQRQVQEQQQNIFAPSSSQTGGNEKLQSPSLATASSGPDLRSQSSNMTSTSSLIGGQPLWVVLGIASGACAAINGVFAKLTTTSLTSTLSAQISTLLGLAADNNYVNVILRGSFFGLNLLFNGIMWALFTAALAKGTSTTRVSIVNVSANFFITAMLGWLIFSEKLPLQWWLGAALLACGNVVIGRREEGEKPGGTSGLDMSAEEAGQAEGLLGSTSDSVEGDLLELDQASIDSRGFSRDEEVRLKIGEDADAPL